ncbi:MAG: tRNA pseudouridine(55) synthase TruB [Selenomonadaceae bacterium]|nr:tRNA pseudouridine(55) synthase TruB [Selenomonadaceae bacterium]
MNDGFINLNKAAGMTSHDAVNIVRKIFSTKKVGHAGTLDPAAVGVLPVAVGQATKFIEYISDFDKTYRAEILFGLKTSTGDFEGEIVSQVKSIVLPPKRALESILERFTGKIFQVPPKHSAIKINGRKAYDLARKNIEFEMPRRLVTINKIEILNVAENILTLEIDCSKGTYIRTLAEDIGESLKLPATLKFLQRVRVGNFYLENSATLDALKISGGKFLLPVDFCLNHLKIFELPSRRVKAFCNGLPTNISAENEIVRVYAEGKFLGVGKIFNGELKAAKLFIDTKN